jgi:hypothetical protein
VASEVERAPRGRNFPSPGTPGGASNRPGAGKNPLQPPWSVLYCVSRCPRRIIKAVFFSLALSPGS